MQAIALFDTAYDIKNSSACHLSIQISLNGLSFCILDKGSSKYVVLKHIGIKDDLIKEDYYKKLEEILHKDVDLNAEYDSVSMMYVDEKNTLIPSPFFHTQHLKKYFEFNHIMDDLDEIHYNKIESIDAYNVFTIPNQIAIDITRKFPAVKLYHHTTSFLHNHLMYNTSIIDKKVFIHIQHHFFDIMITKAKSLLLYNSFKYKSENDLVFFVLYVFDKYNLNTKNTEVILQGSINNLIHYQETLQTYIEKINQEDLNSKFFYSNALNKTDLSMFINLFNLYNCE